jgi:hypothetical protein
MTLGAEDIETTKLPDLVSAFATLRLMKRQEFKESSLTFFGVGIDTFGSKITGSKPANTKAKLGSAASPKRSSLANW